MENFKAALVSDFPISNVFICLVCISVLRYMLSSARFHTTKGSHEKNQRPPLVPYAIPILGTLPFAFLWDPLRFSQTSPAFWKRQPVRLKTLFRELYIVQGAKEIHDLVRQRSASTLFIHRLFLANVFLLPKTAERTYRKDDSGEHAKPYPGTMVQHRNRVEYHVRISQQRLLLGPGQSSLFRRFYLNATKRLTTLDIGPEWSYLPDFMYIFKSALTAATVDSLAGPALLLRHPSFAQDMWAIDENVTKFILKTPRFMNPKAHQARDRALAAVFDWHAWARQNFTPDAVDGEGNDPFWGCRFFRERQETFSSMDGFDAVAIASEDLSFIWSANTNAIISSFWITLEAFRDPTLLQAIREEVRACVQTDPDSQIPFDVAKLLKQPLLQAVFAENLRLRVHGFLIRYPELGDIHINNWTIRRNHWCIASSTPASMDPNFWCAGENSAYPVDRFWPGRFLKRDPDTNALNFSLGGTEGSWVPFGGGPHACPGRMFTKRQNILTLALMVTLYDCEILANKSDMELQSGVYPLGTVPPQGKVPVRMRRRTAT
ncbi:cytochrome P450 [Annulohypoxylon truncatum]|uniref:cytochrome P450 n=1 Tax=Annulohypoxylon truncatum TaxID=327061 RepID=UPI002007BF72|nr:cytochrome P450 [Annulohypoxylon truncatum]KAI1212616.1 cytochrome P450 [Annulohypoxylon truncatum]